MKLWTLVVWFVVTATGCWRATNEPGEAGPGCDAGSPPPPRADSGPSEAGCWDEDGSVRCDETQLAPLPPADGG